MGTFEYMLLKFHYVFNRGVGCRVKITTEDNTVLLNWCRLQESHPLCQLIGPDPGARVNFWSDISTEEYIALGIADLVQDQSEA